MTARNETSKHGAGSEKNKRQDEQAAGSHDDVSFKLQSDRFRWSFEDPMHNYIKLQKMRDKEERVKELQSMLETSSSSSESSDDSSGTSHRKHKQRSRSESSTSHRKHKQRKEDKPRKKEKYKSEVWIEKRDDKNDTDKKKRKRRKDYKQHKSKKRKGADDDVRTDYHVDTYSQQGTTVKEENSDKTEKFSPNETIHRGERKYKKSKHRHKKDKHS
ncbi:pre-mRNA-splicing factor CWC22 homolog isoform X2 [Mercenaria mercenaria]|uniref:pre-mRNA-splicing factor CWC22 homolog isoform X2 n=1 Tax=Mercenaria mercenaria TaxID=6596 RepID=UPI00234F638B|nr:pre-mRNA-splicing factor CWC22 homolog isoform X2 [Mercenaria mercenaria]